MTTMRLNTLKPAEGAKHAKKRVGRGVGSGLGKTAGRGHKGQHSRAGGYHKVGFEGGQMPLQRRLPKRGFHNLFRKEYAPLNIGTLDAAIAAGKIDASQPITEAVLIASGVADGDKHGVRLLGVGAITRAITITVSGASATARAAIEQAGGSLTTTVAAKAAPEAA